ncbi:MAG: GGDEF domain-containing protein [Dissulfurimicrobium sp.]|uniref:GGDEF domain-containing protein n=2 Tax=Dissulfurimicrobium hydrothermale TaxID=1750598 RepID=UPI001EDA6B9D|nr:diguanylate cyclase [Dissulfurimicrobium hydrothermale]UKL13955.1 diguanylate cyclase [Dissulfurimicrobium hydrothermale]
MILEEFINLKNECLRLRSLSETDGLTGLYNYNYLIKTLDIEMERTLRTGLPTALIMIDLDHFKKINDVYGHEAGNAALRAAAGIWRKNVRRMDVVCRYGGEEFTIVLPGTRLNLAVKSAQRLRQALAVSPVDVNGSIISLTASFGVEVFGHANEFSSPEAFIKSADEMLLAAKREGRDRVCFREMRKVMNETALGVDEKKALMRCNKHDNGRLDQSPDGVCRGMAPPGL